MEHKQAIETGTYDGLPAIAPLVLPTRTFSGALDLEIGDIRLNLIEANIHSDDATVIWLAGAPPAPGRRHDGGHGHLRRRARRLREPTLPISTASGRSAPNASCPTTATPASSPPAATASRSCAQRSSTSARSRDAPPIQALRDAPLREVIAGPLQAGWINYFAPYEDVHRRNVDMTLAPHDGLDHRRAATGSGTRAASAPTPASRCACIAARGCIGQPEFTSLAQGKSLKTANQPASRKAIWLREDARREQVPRAFSSEPRASYLTSSER